MIVCLCYGVSDREIKALINEGVRGASAICKRTGAGQGCGMCCEQIVELAKAPKAAMHDACPSKDEGGSSPTS